MSCKAWVDAGLQKLILFFQSFASCYEIVFSEIPGYFDLLIYFLFIYLFLYINFISCLFKLFDEHSMAVFIGPFLFTLQTTWSYLRRN